MPDPTHTPVPVAEPGLEPDGQELCVTAENGVHGGPSYSYRGATIHSNKHGTLFSLAGGPRGLPGRWASVRSLDLILPVVDRWLDRGKLPAPDVDPTVP